VSARPAANALAALRFKPEFGAPNVYTLRATSEEDESEKRSPATSWRTRRLFGAGVTRAKLASLLSQEWTVCATKLTEEFAPEAWREAHGGRAITLFSVDERGRLRVETPEAPLELAAGQTAVALVPPEAEAGSGA